MQEKNLCFFDPRITALRPHQTLTPLHVTLHATFQSDAELRLSQGRVKYVMLGGTEVVVGTSIAPYDLMHASWCCGGPLPRPRPHLTLIPLHDTPCDFPKRF